MSRQMRESLSQAASLINVVGILASIPLIAFSLIAYLDAVGVQSTSECNLTVIRTLLLISQILAWLSLLCAAFGTIMCGIEFFAIRRGTGYLSNVISVAFFSPLTILNILTVAIYSVFFYGIYRCEKSDAGIWGSIFIVVYWCVTVVQILSTILCFDSLGMFFLRRLLKRKRQLEKQGSKGNQNASAVTPPPMTIRAAPSPGPLYGHEFPAPAGFAQRIPFHEQDPLAEGRFDPDVPQIRPFSPPIDGGSLVSAEPLRPPDDSYANDTSSTRSGSSYTPSTLTGGSASVQTPRDTVAVRTLLPLAGTTVIPASGTTRVVRAVSRFPIISHLSPSTPIGGASSYSQMSSDTSSYEGSDSEPEN